MPTWPKEEYGRVVVEDAPLGLTLMSREFAWGKHDTVYTIYATLLPLEGEGVHGVQILREDTSLVSPRSGVWHRIWREYLQHLRAEEEKGEGQPFEDDD
jgi:hypothetical protein